MQRLKQGLIGLALLAIAGHLSTATATPITLQLTYSALFGAPVTGLGSVTFDDSLLAPNSFTGGDPVLSLDAFSLTVFSAEFPGGSTLFALSDLQGWSLSIDGTGGISGIVDLNFFMGDFLADPNSFAVNSDGAAIQGAENRQTEVFLNGEDLGVMELTGIIELTGITEDSPGGTVSVPEPTSAALLGFGLLALSWARRRRGAARNAVA